MSLECQHDAICVWGQQDRRALRTSLWTQADKHGGSSVYINPKAPAKVKDLLAEHFSDVSRVSSAFMQEVTGGFEDEGPPLSEYAAVLLDEEGELHLLEPVIR